MNAIDIIPPGTVLRVRLGSIEHPTYSEVVFDRKSDLPMFFVTRDGRVFNEMDIIKVIPHEPTPTH